MNPTASLLAAGALALFVGGCGYREVAPPEAPARIVPSDVEPRTSPPEAGHTRVLIDANGERATVTEIVDVTTATAHADTVVAYGRSETTKTICVTPCVTDLKPGAHALRFTSVAGDRESEVTLQLGDKPKVLRHAMGRTDDNFWPQFGATWLVALGAATAAGGALWYALARDRENAPNAFGLIAGGGGGLLIGIPLLLLTRPTRQAGASTELALP